MKSAKPTIQPAAFQLKGSLFTLTALYLLQTDVDILLHQLEALVKTTPNFFRNAPIIIDLEKVMESYDNIDFARIKAELVHRGLIPIGIRNGNNQQVKAALEAGLGVLPQSAKNESGKAKSVTNNKIHFSKVVSQPVRSGQQVYAQGGDLIVLASVSPGAELMADGNIHVYGTLRGRALAGVTGDTASRIFCHKLEPELISIAGFYKLRDDIAVPEAELGIQIYLEDEKFQISAI